MKSGLVSVTFRNLCAEDVIRLARSAGVQGIEWGADIHAKPGELKRAEWIGEETRANGIEVACYGSYLRMTEEERAAGDVDAVIDTALALKAPVIRVWAGTKGSAAADETHRRGVASALRAFAERAAAVGLRVALEFHGDTLTDTTESALHLLRAVDMPNLRSLWQPPVGMDQQRCLASLHAMSPYLENLHVFTWRGTERRPLKEGGAAWSSYMDAARTLPGQRYALLEFVRDDDPAQFFRDARTLRQWLTA